VNALSLVNFADLAVNTLNWIGSVNNLADTLIVFKECRKLHPVIHPELAAQRIFLVPFLFNSSNLS